MFLQISQIQSPCLACTSVSGSTIARWPRQCLQLTMNLWLRISHAPQNHDPLQSGSSSVLLSISLGGGSRGSWGPSKRSGGGERGGLGGERVDLTETAARDMPRATCGGVLSHGGVLCRGGVLRRGGVLSRRFRGGVGARARRLRTVDFGPGDLGLTGCGSSRRGTSRWSDLLRLSSFLPRGGSS